MRDIARRLGRKLEVDGRFTLDNALGEYRPKVGVLRIRHEGDFQVFAHEAGHAIDYVCGTRAPLVAMPGPSWSWPTRRS